MVAVDFPQLQGRRIYELDGARHSKAEQQLSHISNFGRVLFVEADEIILADGRQFDIVSLFIIVGRIVHVVAHEFLGSLVLYRRNMLQEFDRFCSTTRFSARFRAIFERNFRL